MGISTENIFGLRNDVFECIRMVVVSLVASNGVTSFLHFALTFLIPPT